MDFGIASVAAITVICYLIGQVVKASGLDNNYIPAIVRVCGGVLPPGIWGGRTFRRRTRRPLGRWASWRGWRLPA